MDWFSILKFVHILAAIIWLGGAFAILAMEVLARRTGPDAILAHVRNAEGLALPVFVPASLTTILSGVTLSIFWIGFSDLWILIGLAGAVSTFLIGILSIKPTVEKLKAMIERDGVNETVLAMGRRLTRVGRFDYAAMVVVVAAMVFKPGYDNYLIVGAMAVWIVATALFFLVPPGEGTPHTA